MRSEESFEWKKRKLFVLEHKGLDTIPLWCHKMYGYRIDSLVTTLTERIWFRWWCHGYVVYVPFRKSNKASFVAGRSGGVCFFARWAKRSMLFSQVSIEFLNIELCTIAQLDGHMGPFTMFTLLSLRKNIWHLCFEDQTHELPFCLSSFIFLTFPIPARSEMIANTQWPTAYSTKTNHHNLCEGQLCFLVLACTSHGLVYLKKNINWLLKDFLTREVKGSWINMQCVCRRSLNCFLWNGRYYYDLY